MPLRQSEIPQLPAAGKLDRAALRSGGTAQIRRAAAQEMGEDPSALHELAAALGHEPDSAVRTAIITALLRIGGEAACAELARFLSSEDANLRNDALAALQSIGAPAAPVAQALLASADEDMRLFAVQVLQGVQLSVCRGWLHDVLAHETVLNVGLAAVELLAHRGSEADVDMLRAFGARFPNDAFVAFAVGHACRRAAA